MKKLTLDKLKSSNTWKRWIKNENDIVLIHDIYYDSDKHTEYIVIIKEKSSYTILRFFEMSDKIYADIDFNKIKADDVFKHLLNKYSSGLK